MNRIVLILLCIMFFISSTSYSNTTDNKPVKNKPIKNLKIFMVQSYEQNNFCGSPQLYGLKESLSELRMHHYRLILREFYMNTKTKNTTPIAIREIAKTAYESIKLFNPDYIVIFDDNAFNYLAIPYLLTDINYDWKVIFSGLNKKINTYADDLNFSKDKIAGVEETVQLQKLHKWFQHIGYIPDTFYVLRDSTLSSYLLTLNIQFELKKYGYTNIKIIFVDDTIDLRRNIRRLNKLNKGILISLLTSLFDPDTGKNLTMYNILREISDYNSKHIEIATNAGATRPEVGFAIAVGPDFYQMGIDAGSILTNIILSDKFESRISSSVNSLTVNTARMSELGLVKEYKSALNQFDRIYTTIED